MAQRKYGRSRCEGCGLHEELCVCDELPRLRVDTRVVVVRQIRERFKPTNTGKLVTRVLENAALVDYGMRDAPFDASALADDSVDRRVLFPAEEAVPLEELPTVAPGAQRTFVVLDGTWHQCSRMLRRVPVVQDMPAVVLPPGPPSIWPARVQHDPRGLSTFEAVARLLGHLEGEEVARTMEESFARIAARLAYMKGTLKTPEVPAHWRGAFYRA